MNEKEKLFKTLRVILVFVVMIPIALVVIGMAAYLIPGLLPLATAQDVSSSHGPSKLDTAANFGLRTFDAGQTCYLLQQPNWHERTLPTQSCAAVVGIDAGFASASFFADRWLLKHNHPRLAHFQLVSAGGAGIGIGYSFTH